MPTITLSKNELMKSIGKKLSDDELKDRISMLGTDLEGIEGDEITVEVFPNRPDLLSQRGFARALASFVGARTGLAHYAVTPSGEQVIIDRSVASCRPYTACAIVKHLSINEERLKEMIQLQEKLHVTFGRNRKRLAIGIYPVEHIAFPIHFKGLKPGEIKFRPLESAREMTAKEIIEQHPKGKEYAHLLAGLERYACFLDAKGDFMSLTPIINSYHTGKITATTKEVFIECSGFDLRLLRECLNMIVTALADMGGTVFSLELHYPDKKIVTPDLTARKMKADLPYINRLLGLGLKEAEAKHLFERMGFGYEKGSVLIPAYRADIIHQVDLAEEIAIAYGFEKIPETIPNLATIAEESPFSAFCAKVRRRLTGHGLVEVKNYNLISSETQRRASGSAAVMVANAVSEEYDSLRASILPSLLDTLQRNRRHEYPQRLFEIGRTFTKGKTETGVVEVEKLGVILCDERADYTAIRKILDDLFAAIGVETEYAAHEDSCLLPGRTAQITGKRSQKPLAVIGEVHPEILARFQLEMPAAAFELDLQALFSLLR
jgi:phenylalanyl-tRNA synthetase beta chain